MVISLAAQEVDLADSLVEDPQQIPTALAIKNIARRYTNGRD